MLRLLQHIKTYNHKTFLFSLLVLSLFASATSYASYVEVLPKLETSLVYSEVKSKVPIHYDAAIRIAFPDVGTPYPSSYQERFYSLQNGVAYTNYARQYITPSQKGFYIHTTLSKGELPPTTFL